MGTTHTTTAGPGGTGAAGLAGRVILASDIVDSQPLGGDRMSVKLRSGETVIARKLPDGRIIRGAEVGDPDT